MGFATNRREARQFITHGHFTVNGKTVSIPSYLVKAGDVIEVREKSRKIPSLVDNMSRLENREIPAWVEVDSANFKGKVLHIPSREEMQLPVQEQLIVELYSK
jgi:small subunit ribosomal protein S4